VFNDDAVTPLLRRADLKRRIASRCAGTMYLFFVFLMPNFLVWVKARWL
jgi:hypothetical protein